MKNMFLKDKKFYKKIDFNSKYFKIQKIDVINMGHER